MRRVLLVLSAGLMLLVAASPGHAAPAPAAGPHWSLVASPDQNGDGQNGLYAVSALSSTDAWAVGFTSVRSSNTFQTLIEHWDGATWSIVPSPSPGLTYNTLLTVLAIAPDDVWAAGSKYDSGPTSNLFLHWDGGSWTVVPNPALPDGAEFWTQSLTRIPGTSTFIAAGSSFDPQSGAERMLALEWTGSAWKILPAKTPVGLPGRFQAVAAANGHDIVGVGVISTASGQAGKALGEQWDGATFRMIRPHSPWPGDNQLLGITRVPGSTNMWAVGWGKNSGPRAITEYWDGTDWTVEPTATTNEEGLLYGVAAVRSDRVWAVGSAFTGGPLVERWNGTSWSVETMPDGRYRLYSVTRIPGTGQLWAVGGGPGTSAGSSATAIVRYGA